MQSAPELVEEAVVFTYFGQSKDFSGHRIHSPWSSSGFLHFRQTLVGGGASAAATGI
jgi:hypothetical protein